jgi:hypothetical protein
MEIHNIETFLNQVDVKYCSYPAEWSQFLTKLAKEELNLELNIKWILNHSYEYAGNFFNQVIMDQCFWE